MKKIIILTVVISLFLVSVIWAAIPAKGPRISYGGYVQKNTDGTVAADTVIWVFNPNNFNIAGVGIAVFDKYGVKVADTLLLNGGTTITQIPPKGWGWQTIGNLIPTPAQAGPATKYTFVVYWTKPTQTPNRGLVIEIKEIVYQQYIQYGCMECHHYPHYPPYPQNCWDCHALPWEHKLVPVPTSWQWPGSIRQWSEADIGKGGTGFSGN